jgi:hypothetical protein
MTFAFPMLLFIVVAVALYVLYTKPAAVPGHRTSTPERPVSYTAMPGTPTPAEVPDSLAAAVDAAIAGDGDSAVPGENTVPEAQE